MESMESTESFHKLFTHILTLNIHDVFMVHSFAFDVHCGYQLLRLVIYKSFNFFLMPSLIAMFNLNPKRVTLMFCFGSVLLFWHFNLLV